MVGKKKEKTLVVRVSTTGAEKTVTTDGTVGELKELVGGLGCSRWVFTCNDKVLTEDSELLAHYAGKTIELLPDPMGGAGFGEKIEAALKAFEKDADGYYLLAGKEEETEALRLAINATAKFEGCLKLRNAVFRGYAFFGGDADFGGNAFFEGDVDFGGCAFFRGYAFFGGCAFFRGYAFFGGDADFKGDAFFGGDADFGGDAVFRRGADFGGDAVFRRGAFFGGYAFFRGYAVFRGNADFKKFARFSTIGWECAGKTKFAFGKAQEEYNALVARARVIADLRKTEEEIALTALAKVGAKKA